MQFYGISLKMNTSTIVFITEKSKGNLRGHIFNELESPPGRSENPTTVEEVCRWAEQIIDGLAYIHQFGSMPVLEETKTMVYVTNHNMITMTMAIFKTYKMADKGEERVLTEILVYSCFIESFICLLLTMNWEVP